MGGDVYWSDSGAAVTLEGFHDGSVGTEQESGKWSDDWKPNNKAQKEQDDSTIKLEASAHSTGILSDLFVVCLCVSVCLYCPKVHSI